MSGQCCPLSTNPLLLGEETNSPGTHEGTSHRCTHEGRGIASELRKGSPPGGNEALAWASSSVV